MANDDDRRDSRTETTQSNDADSSPAYPNQYRITRWFFLRALGLVHLFAVTSFWSQAHGLIGSEGILPVADFLVHARDQLGATAYYQLPTLLWINAGDLAITLVCLTATVCALLLIAGIAPTAALVGLWVAYLSLFTAGQDFLGFQWDTLLLETTFVAIFLAPCQIWPRFARETEPPAIPIWLLRWILFRLMFSSGVVKLPDVTWQNLSALSFHYETQPLPTLAGWYMHQLPLWFHQASVVGMFAIELIVPFLIFGPRPVRTIAFPPLVALQLLIALTGNYGYFNVLALALCLVLLDDGHWRSMLPDRILRWFAADGTPAWHKTRRAVLIPVAVIIVCLSIVPLWRLLPGSTSPPPPVPHLYEGLYPLHLVSGYGLFARMTTERPEIVLEGSADGETWQPYRFRYKPGALDQPPVWVQPHMPRLDWQMWFAALSPGPPRWVQGLAYHLLTGSPTVYALFDDPPFAGDPPRYIRAVRYQYRFTTIEERRATGEWWARSDPQLFLPPVSLRR